MADAFIERGVPVVCVSGCDRPSISTRYDHVPLCMKPVASEQAFEALSCIASR